MEKSIPMLRFRPNIVVEGVKEAWEEDKWKRVKIGEFLFWHNKPCDRCKVPTIVVEEGAFSEDGEPTKTLHKFRKINGKVYFGINLIHKKYSGKIKVGDKLQVLE